MSNPGSFRGAVLGAAVALVSAASWAVPAHAQTSITALVNGTPITSSEVAERRALVRLTQKKDISQRQALDQLIDMALLAAEAKRRSVTIPDSDVDQRFEAVAKNAKLSNDQLNKALLQSGASPRAFKAEIRSALLQRRVMGMLSRTATGISEKDIALGITAKKSEGAGPAYRYTMQQIVFVSPKGAGAGQVNQRKTEAESFRRRVQSCDDAVSVARQLRDVAVKPPVTRMSAQLPPTFRDELAAMKVGQSTKADATDMGVEVIVLCDKQETADDSALRTEVQNELVMEQGKGEVEKYIADLRKRALVIYK